MSIVSTTIDSFGFWGTTSGFSTEANALSRAFSQSLEHYLEPRLNLLVPEIESLADESDGGRQADSETIQAAVQFAYCLPRFAPLPEVSVDPDGEISFDWISRNGEMFSVSINRQNRLAYAGWFGEKSRIHGVEQLGQKCPEQIIKGIQRAAVAERLSEFRPVYKALHGHR